MPESELFKQIASLSTEQINKSTIDIDIAETEQILEMINDQDQLVPLAVKYVIPEIAKAVDNIVQRFNKGGRLFYIGAGTSGRLGIVDASECPPTFGTDPEMVQGLIAGGIPAIFKAQEGAEDSEKDGAAVIDEKKINSNDIICGIAASGRTPFVIGALKEAHKKEIYSIIISTVPKEKLIDMLVPADCYICPNVGPEVIAGSTRMKSGTAQKLILNMITTASMVKLGKTYNNVMVDLQLTNAKLYERAKRILMDICDIDYDSARQLLSKSQGNVKAAILMSLKNVDYESSLSLLKSHGGILKKAILE